MLGVAYWVFGSGLPAVPAGADRGLADIAGDFWFYAFLATFFGIVLTYVIGKLTEYFTAAEKETGDGNCDGGEDGPAALILSGLAEGLESSVWSAVSIAATIYGASRAVPRSGDGGLCDSLGRSGPVGDDGLRAGRRYVRSDFGQRERGI
ncbi:MAG: sodium/proton-translocating pyrophosphatase [bacterium]|nr:sodium/proton-translocating pyrophosphatase [bacterium]